ncbi:pol poly [Schistosoma japonicum]|uniref:Pol poly n=1 Tax=Schistosoma japonicum TaxID=6182 RepID=A0A4Z2DLX3_SCHJA|nr:pol poly [Schistosoma japonicum]
MTTTLHEATYVDVNRGGVQRPLQPVYEGPYQVLKRNDKVIMIDMHEKIDTVSTDRVELESFDNDNVRATSNAPTLHCYGIRAPNTKASFSATEAFFGNTSYTFWQICSMV